MWLFPLRRLGDRRSRGGDQVSQDRDSLPRGLDARPCAYELILGPSKLARRSQRLPFKLRCHRRWQHADATPLLLKYIELGTIFRGGCQIWRLYPVTVRELAPTTHYRSFYHGRPYLRARAEEDLLCCLIAGLGELLLNALTTLGRSVSTLCL